MVAGLVASAKSQILSHWSLTASGVMGLFFCLTVWPRERSQRTAHMDTHKYMGHCIVKHHTHTVLVNLGQMNVIHVYRHFFRKDTQYSHLPIQPPPTWKKMKHESIRKQIANANDKTCNRQSNGTIYIFFICIPQTVLHFLGIVHDRARGPREQHTLVLETSQGLKMTHTHLRSVVESNNVHLLKYCALHNLLCWSISGQFCSTTSQKEIFFVLYTYLPVLLTCCLKISG